MSTTRYEGDRLKHWLLLVFVSSVMSPLAGAQETSPTERKSGTIDKSSPPEKNPPEKSAPEKTLVEPSKATAFSSAKIEAATALYKIAYSTPANRNKFWEAFVETLDAKAFAGKMALFLQKAGLNNDKAARLSQERATEIMIRFGEDLPSISDEELEKATVTLIDRSLTLDEIKTLQTFYESIAGKKVLEEVPAAVQNAHANTLQLILPYVIKLAKQSYEDMPAGPFPSDPSLQPVSAEKKAIIDRVFKTQAEEVDHMIKEDLRRNITKPKGLMQLSPAEKAMMDQKAIAEFDSWNAKMNTRLKQHEEALSKLPIANLFLSEVASEISSKFTDAEIKSWADVSQSGPYSKMNPASTEGLSIFAELSAKKQEEMLNKLLEEVLTEAKSLK